MADALTMLEPGTTAFWKACANAADAADLARRYIQPPAGWRIESARIARVYPARPNGMGVEWQLRLSHRDGTSTTGRVYVTAAREGRRARRNRLRIAPQGVFNLCGLAMGIEEPGTIIHTPDRDRRLDVRHVCNDKLLERRLESEAALEWLTGHGPLQVRLLSYRPQRRCTVALSLVNDTSGRFVVAKVMRSGSAERVLLAHRRVRAQLRRCTDVCVATPAIVAHWPDVNTIVFEGLSRTVSPRGLTNATVRAAARILAAMHASECPSLPTFTRDDELHATARWLEVARQLNRLSPTARRIHDWLDDASKRLPTGRRHVIHRDFYDEQIVRTPQGWAVVDLDTVALGDCEQDIGNYVGHLLWSAIRDGETSSVAFNGAGRFLDCYLRAAGRTNGVVNPQRLRFYLVSSLLRVGLIHGLRTGSKTRAAHLHELAMSLCGASPLFASGRARCAGSANAFRRPV